MRSATERKRAQRAREREASSPTSSASPQSGSAAAPAVGWTVHETKPEGPPAAGPVVLDDETEARGEEARAAQGADVAQDDAKAEAEAEAAADAARKVEELELRAGAEMISMVMVLLYSVGVTRLATLYGERLVARMPPHLRDMMRANAAALLDQSSVVVRQAWIEMVVKYLGGAGKYTHELVACASLGAGVAGLLVPDPSEDARVIDAVVAEEREERTPPRHPSYQDAK